MIELTAHRLRGSATHSPVLWAVPWATSVVFAGGSAAADSLRMRICRMGWLSIAPSWASASAHVRRSQERLCFSCLWPAKGRPGSHFRDHELAGRGDSANPVGHLGCPPSTAICGLDLPYREVPSGELCVLGPQDRRAVSLAELAIARVVSFIAHEARASSL